MWVVYCDGMASALATKRQNTIESLGIYVKELHNGEVNPKIIAQYIVDMMDETVKHIRGPENCEWKNTANGLRQYAGAFLTDTPLGDGEVVTLDTFKWAVTQWTIYFVYAADNPARVPNPRPALDPNSEAYRSM